MTNRTRSSIHYLIVVLSAIIVIGCFAAPKVARADQPGDYYCFLQSKQTFGPISSIPSPYHSGDNLIKRTEYSNGQVGYQIIFFTYNGNGTWNYGSAFIVSGCGNPTFSDGRLNSRDADQTAAVYCEPNGTIEIWSPSAPVWKLSFTVSPTELAAVPEHPASNTLIKKHGHYSLYRLTTGELQVNAPGLNPSKGDYVFRFKGCNV